MDKTARSLLWWYIPDGLTYVYGNGGSFKTVSRGNVVAYLSGE
jgi:hypothetical protein